MQRFVPITYSVTYLLVGDRPLAIILLSESTVESGDHQRTTWRQQLVGYIQTPTNCDLDGQPKRDIFNSLLPFSAALIKIVHSKRPSWKIIIQYRIKCISLKALIVNFNPT